MRHGVIGILAVIVLVGCQAEAELDFKTHPSAPVPTPPPLQALVEKTGHEIVILPEGKEIAIYKVVLTDGTQCRVGYLEQGMHENSNDLFSMSCDFSTTASPSADEAAKDQ